MFDNEIALIAGSIDHITQKRGRRVVGFALLGKGDGSGTLVVPNGLPREIWARRSDTRELFTLYLPPNSVIAFQDGNAAIETIEMRYGYETDNSRLQILDALTSAGQQAVGSQSPIEQTIAQAYWTPLDHITTLRAAPSSPVSTNVSVAGPLWYPRSSTSKYLFQSGTTSLSTQITALAAGKHQLAVLYLDTATGSLGVLTNTAATAAGTLPSRSEWAYTDVQAISIASTYIPIIVIYLYYGQTAVAEADFYRTWDLRPMFGGGGTGGVTGPSPSTDRAIATWNGTGGTALFNNSAATVNAGGDLNANSLSTAPSWAVTISAGAIAVAGGWMVVSASSGVTDTLNTVSSVPQGKRIVLRAASGHTITVATGAGNIFLNGGSNFVLSGDKSLELFCDGTHWEDLSAGGAGGGANTALSNLAATAVNADILPSADNLRALGSAALRYSNIWAVNTLNDVNAIPVKNVSGSTANAGDLGILQYDATNGYSYTTTTTANLNAMWCVVIVGAANNSTIYVATRGKVTVKLNANCAINNFLLTSTTAGQASVSTTMRPEIFAVALSANAGGAGGTCTAQLLCNTIFVPQVSSNLLWGCYNHSASDFVSVINGAPTATSVTYGNVSAGNANAIVPANSTDLGKMILWNTTRSTGRLITAVNTTTKVITTVSTVDAWANADAITIESQTVVNAAAARFVDVDLSQQTTIPTLARSIWIMMQKLDSGGGNITQITHPWETIASSKNKTLWYQTTNFWIDTLFPLPLINGRFAIAYGASGVGTALDELYLQGFEIAAP